MPVIIVAGLGYGDEGKGATVDFLSQKYRPTLTIRYNGGPQTAHNVVLPNRTHHTFSQFTSGAFLQNDTYGLTFLSKFMLVNPLSLLAEAQHLENLGISNALSKVVIDDRAVIITPFHKAINRLTEWSRKENRHGSCGLGIGEARRLQIQSPSNILLANHLYSGSNLKNKLRWHQAAAQDALDNLLPFVDISIPQVKREIEIITTKSEDVISYCTTTYLELVGRLWGISDYLRDYFSWSYDTKQTIIFEGAQGLWLDETIGTAPHNTWTNTTFGNALKLLADSHYDGKVRKIGVLRTYLTRHGEGPFDEDATIDVPEPHNNASGFQGAFRKGRLTEDWLRRTRQLMETAGVEMPNEIALNHLDYADKVGFTPELEAKIEEILAPITIRGYGPSWTHRQEAEQGAVKKKNPVRKEANEVIA